MCRSEQRTGIHHLSGRRPSVVVISALMSLAFATVSSLGTVSIARQVPAEKVKGKQGQRPLKCCPGKDFQQEVFVPTTTAALHRQAQPGGMLLQE